MNSRPTPLHRIDDEACRRVQDAVEMVGQRWTSGIMLAIFRGAHRFTEIVAVVDGLSGRMLSVRLKELERLGIVAREVTPSTPVQVRYRLTDSGADLLAALDDLLRWRMAWEADRADGDAAVG